MKSTKPKPKPAPAPPDYMPACRKVGRSVQFSFLRAIRTVLECSEAEAIAEFDRAVESGKIVQDGTNAMGDVKIYLAK